MDIWIGCIVDVSLIVIAQKVNNSLLIEPRIAWPQTIFWNILPSNQVLPFFLYLAISTSIGLWTIYISVWNRSTYQLRGMINFSPWKLVVMAILVIPIEKELHSWGFRVHHVRKWSLWSYFHTTDPICLIFLLWGISTRGGNDASFTAALQAGVGI